MLFSMLYCVLIFCNSNIMEVSPLNSISYVMNFCENCKQDIDVWIWCNMWYLICLQFLNLLSTSVKSSVIVIFFMVLYEVIFWCNNLGSSKLVLMKTSNHCWSLANLELKSFENCGLSRVMDIKSIFEFTACNIVWNLQVILPNPINILIIYKNS